MRDDKKNIRERRRKCTTRSSDLFMIFTFVSLVLRRPYGKKKKDDLPTTRTLNKIQ